MQADIYEVLDSVTGGLRLQVELQPRVNFSLASSGIPFIRALVVHNETGAALSGVELTAKLTMVGADSALWMRTIEGPLEANSVTRIDDGRAFGEFAPLLSSATEATPATLELTATAGTAETRISAAIEVSAYNEFLNFPGFHAALAAFVQPNTRQVTRILRAASDLLLKRTGSGALQGYQAGAGRAEEIGGAIYAALSGLEVTYINPPASFERTGQKVRTTEQVTTDRFGTCVDLAVLYAACVEAAGLFPVIFLTRNHAFAGYHRTEQFADVATIETVNTLTNLVEIGEIVPVELTGIGPGRQRLNYRGAVKAGTAYFREQFDYLQTMVDITRARIDGVRPMPGVGAVAAPSDDDVELDRPFVARSSRRGLTAAIEEEVVRGVRESHDDSPARFKAWKRDLLDLSLRNPLLNMPRTSKVLDLLVPGGLLPKLDDLAHSGRGIRLLSSMDSSELLKLAGARAVSELSADFVSTMLATHTAFTAKDETQHWRQLRSMKREATTLEQETGSNYLYLTLGTLVHDKPGGGEARAPLFLLPMRITGGIAFTSYGMKLDGDEIAQPNLCLLEWLKSTKGLDLDELAHPALDDNGLAITSVMASIRKRLVDAGLPYRVDETASLAILKFSTFQIWKDLDENWRELGERPVVKHLVERPGETFIDPAGTAQVAIDEETLRLPIAADGSQIAAIVRASSGQSFVLEGPPGTGKSQTITNLIAHALTTGKKVLFVAEKQAALEVVKRRLDAVGLGAFGLELHGSSQSMKSIRDQLKRSLELRVSPDSGRWTATDSRLRTATAALERYPELVHDRNAAGHSLWSAYDELGGLGDGPVASIRPDWLGAEHSSDVVELTRELSSAASRFGLRPGHPWILVGATDPALLDAAAVSSGLAELAAARRRVSSLSDAWRAALAEAAPNGALDAILQQMDASHASLAPTPGHIAYIDRPSWTEAVAALRSRLADYEARHANVLAAVLPEGFEIPDLPAIVAQSAALDEAWFFPTFRRRHLLERVRAVLRAPATVESDQLTDLVRAITAAQESVSPDIQGLLLPEGWMPYKPGASAQLDAAVATSLRTVWLAQHAPLASGALETMSDADENVLRDLDQAWTRWLGALGGGPETVTEWSAGRDWVDAWAQAEAEWQRDIDTTGILQPQRFTESRRLIEALRVAGLADFASQVGSGTIGALDAPEALLRGLATSSLDERVRAGALDSFDFDAQDRVSAAYRDNSELARELMRTIGPARLLAQRPFDADNLRGEVAELGRQISRKRGGLSFREITRRYPDALLAVAPVFLMSPGSVAHYLDAGSLEFDLVIFDEASQIRVSQAIGAMGRGRAVVVVGDSKQMPPTRVMQVEVSADEVSGDEELVVEDLESILTEAVESGLPQLWLGWHYRSQDESLIAFSNARYYDSRLVSLPAPGSDPDAGVSWRRVEGSFDRGRNRVNEIEAAAIVDEITARLRNPETASDSIGVVCFNIQQRDLILNLLEESSDLLVQRALTLEPGRALFVKNLENVQGDERDTILFSLAFSVDASTGILPLNFGPLNLNGGERRLNVAVTRARKQIVLFSSFDPADIDLKRSKAQGIADLKRYLEFAATRVPLTTVDQVSGYSNRGRLVDELSSALVAAGYEVESELGLSAFKIDLAVRKPGATEWRLAIMVDGPGWNSRPTVADREGSATLLVDLMGWDSVTRVWLPAWLRDPAGVLARLVELLELPVVERVRPTLVPVVVVEDEDVAPVEEDAAAAQPSTMAGLDGAHARAAVTRFVPAADSVIASQSVLNNMRMAAPAIERIALEALDTEGPMSIARLCSLVSRRFGYSRIGDGKRTELTAAIVAVIPVVDGFAWPRSWDPATWRGVRTSTTTDRAVTEVSPQEVLNAMELVVRESFSLSREDLHRETASVLGYARITEPARRWFDTALAHGIAASRLSESGARIRLP
jgi:hypothetical protein